MHHINKKTWQSQVVLTVIFALITVCFIWQITPNLMLLSANTQPLTEQEPETTEIRKEEEAIIIETTDYIKTTREPKIKTINKEVIIPTEPVTEPVTEPIIEPATEEMIVKQYNGIKEGDIIIGEITHYCLCVKCTGSQTGITSSGYVIQNNVQSYTTGCNWLPLGSIIEINGTKYTIRDRGGSWFNSVGKVDIFVPEGHQAALEKGRLKNREIKIIYLSEEQ